METFTGFPEAALDFYDDLEVDNTRSFWQAHKSTYEESVRAPMIALTQTLVEEFGPAKVYRPYRDVRFGKDKTPYKTHQGAFVAAAPATGWYVEIAAPGVRVGAGFYRAEPRDLARIRAGIDDEVNGRRLQALLSRLERDGFEVGGDKVKTTPRGWSIDHPRIDLLRHKSLAASRSYGFEPMIHTAELADRVRRDWGALRGLVEWLSDRVDVIG